MPFDYAPLWISLKVALCATAGVLIIGTLAAWRLAVGKFRGKVLVETVLTLPLVLPPTVVGFYLLMVLGRGTAWGEWLNDSAGVQLLFTWQGATIAAAVMAFPLMVKTAAVAMESVEREFIETARMSGADEWQIFLQVILPLSYKGVLTGAVLAFARGVGEFGATLMIAGNIPGETQTLPLALYSSVQEGDGSAAVVYTVLLTVVSFVILFAIGAYQKSIASRR